MKYIRTKDGRITTLKDELIDNAELWVSGGKENILSTTNTIEELCDEFILVNEYRFKRPKTATELEKDFYEMRSFYTSKNDKIYGAIWTDKGLIYVAKMNEKGELELI